MPYANDTLIAETPTKGGYGNDTLLKTAQEESEGLFARFVRQFREQGIKTPVRQFISSPISPVGFPQTEIRREATELFKAGKVPKEVFALSGDQQKYAIESMAQKSLAQKRIPFVAPAPAETIPEKITDVGAGIAAFIAQLAATRKILPSGMPEPIIWETQNLATGGTPGTGALMYGVFSAPGKALKGWKPPTTLGKVGKGITQTAAESAVMAGVVAGEEKLTTGEIDFQNVLIAAGIPVAFRGIALTKSALRGQLKEQGIKVSQPLQTKTGLKQYNIELPNGRKIRAISFPTPEQAAEQAQRISATNEARGENVKVEVKDNILTMEEWPKWRTLAPEMTTAEGAYPLIEPGARAKPLQRRIVPQLPEEVITAETARAPTITEKPPTKAVEARTPAPPPVTAPEIIPPVSRDIIAKLNKSKSLPIEPASVRQTVYGKNIEKAPSEQAIRENLKYLVEEGVIKIENNRTVLVQPSAVPAPPPVTAPKPIEYTEKELAFIRGARKVEESLLKKGYIIDETGKSVYAPAKANWLIQQKEAAAKVPAPPPVAAPKTVWETVKQNLKSQGKLGIWEEDTFIETSQKEKNALIQTVRKNEGDYAAKIVKDLTNLGIPTVETHATKNEVVVRLGRDLSNENREILNRAEGITFEHHEKFGDYIRVSAPAEPTVIAPKKGFRKGAAYIPTAAELEKLIPKIKPEEAMGAAAARPGFPKKETAEVTPTPPLETAVDKLLTATRKAKKLSKTEVQEAIHKLRSKQAAKGAAIYKAEIAKETPPDIAAQRQKAGYKGAAEAPVMTPPDLSRQEWLSIYNKINYLYPANNPRVTFTRGDTVDAFKKIESGAIPQPAEFGLIEKVIGKKAALGLWESMSPKMPYRAWDYIRDVNTLYKVLKFGYNIQYFYQTATIAQRNPVIFGRGAKTAIQSLLPEETAKLGKYLPGKLKKISTMKFGEQLADAAEQELKNDPRYESSVRAGVNYLSDRPWASWAERAEQYPTDLPARMAKLWKGKPAPLKQLGMPIRAIGQYIAAQNRSMVTSINQTMKGLYDAQSDIWDAQKLTPKQREKFESNYADGINAFVKIIRAKTPTGRAFQKAANYFLTSPSITLSRFYQPFIAIAKPGARLWATTAILSNIAKLYLISYAANLVENWWRARYPDKEPPIQGEINITSADWGKVRSGRSTFDIGGGDAQFYRTAARLITRHYKNEAGKIREMPFWDTVSRYAESRESPFVQARLEEIRGEYFGGEKILETPKTITSRPGKIGWITGKWFWKQIGPVEADDIYTAAKYSGMPQALIAASLSLGVNIQSYPETPATASTKLKDQLAQKQFGTEWDNLDIRQQQDLRKNYPQILESETARRMERERPEEISLREENKSHKEILKRLSPEISDEVKRLNVGVGISRSLGRERSWYLNDQRYQRYQDLAVEKINEYISELIKTDEWLELTDAQKIEILSDVISDAKSAAGAQLMNEEIKQ